ncbi:MAG: hypothetical protein IJX46_06565 [Clostridia bacterium]|nr:hypothetical protein [Clostridia bacterium]
MKQRFRRKKSVDLSARMLIVGAIFAVFCCIFAARLVYYQLVEGDTYASAVYNGNMRTVTVPAARGNICDRNGKVIVTNEYTNDLVIDYDTLPDTRDGVHRVLLDALAALRATGSEDKMADSLFPVEGSYPNYVYSAAALTEGDPVCARLKTFLKNNFEADPDTGIQELTARHSAYELVAYIAEKYNITVDDEGAPKDIFSPEEIDSLVSLRYGMELSGFGAVADYTLAEDVSENLQSYVAERHIRGLDFSSASHRVYKYDGYASHILGTVGPIYAEEAEKYAALGYSVNDTVGKSGCEAAFESYLHGKDGLMAIIEDDEGNVVDQYYIEKPVAGKDVYLTIDIELQVSAEDALRENIETRINAWRGLEADAGAIIATDPQSGEILAIASYPTYDLSTYNADYGELSKLEVSPYLNRSLLAYAPGSTFKVGMALAALEEGLIDAHTVVHTAGIYDGLKCSHYATSGGQTVCCGDINVCEALMVSCNYFFSELGDRLTVEKIRKYAAMFGFGESTGIELGESTGKVATSYPHAAAIGQSDNLCTPLQISQYVAMIANGGTRYAAHILHSVRTADGHVLYSSSPKAAEMLTGVSDENIATVKQGMYDVVSGERASSYVRENFVKVGNEYQIGGYWSTDAAGNRVYVGGKQVGGKTGTAEVDNDKNSTDNAWFTGFAPFDDPEIAVTCFIENGYTGGFASFAVAETMDAYFAAQRRGGK